MLAALRRAVFFFCAFSIVSTARSQAIPTIDTKTPLLEGQTAISGTAQAVDKATYPSVAITFCVTAKPDAPPADCGTGQYVATTPATISTDGNGKYTATLTSPLTAGQWIYAVQVATKTDKSLTTPLAGAAVQVKSMPAATITSTLVAPIKNLAGTGQTPSTALYTAVEVFVCASADASDAKKDCSKSGSALQQKLEGAAADGSTAVASNGQFTANLSSPILSGWTVWLTEVGTLATKIGAQTTVTSESDGVEAASAVKPVISQPLKDGDGGVSGTATPSAASGDKVIVSLEVKKPSDADFVTLGTTVEVGTDGTFTIPHRLTEGEQVKVHQRSTNPTTPITSADSDAVTVNAPDNERVAIDFLAGLLLSQGQQDFSQTNLFLSLNIDETFHKPGWYWKYADKSSCKGHENTAPGAKTACETRNFPGLNGFFQARLTAIPVTSDSATTPSGGTTPTSYDTFLASRKAAHFEMGLYMPWYFGHADVPLSAKSQSFFIAPIARFGFNTLVDSNSDATSTGTATAGTSTQTMQAAVSDSNTKVYSFGVGGARLGTADMRPGSPRAVHYLDVGFGKFTNLRDLYCSTNDKMNACYDATNSVYVPTKEFHDTPWRILVEGYMDIDGFILGFSVNKSFSWRGATRPPDLNANYATISRAADDVRFLFGYKFDVNKLLNSVKKTSNF